MKLVRGFLALCVFLPLIWMKSDSNVNPAVIHFPPDYQFEYLVLPRFTWESFSKTSSTGYLLIRNPMYSTWDYTK